MNPDGLWILGIIAVIIVGMWLIARRRQPCLWCGLPECRYGASLCDFCRTLGTR